jgi:hypothetical protein
VASADSSSDGCPDDVTMRTAPGRPSGSDDGFELDHALEAAKTAGAR